MVEKYPDSRFATSGLFRLVTSRTAASLVHEGHFLAEVEVHLIDTDDGWSPYLSLDDAYRLDDVRDALRSGDIQRASRLATRVYRVTPVA